MRWQAQGGDKVAHRKSTPLRKEFHRLIPKNRLRSLAILLDRPPVFWRRGGPGHPAASTGRVLGPAGWAAPDRKGAPVFTAAGNGGSFPYPISPSRAFDASAQKRNPLAAGVEESERDGTGAGRGALVARILWGTRAQSPPLPMPHPPSEKAPLISAPGSTGRASSTAGPRPQANSQNPLPPLQPLLENCPAVGKFDDTTSTCVLLRIE